MSAHTITPIDPLTKGVIFDPGVYGVAYLFVEESQGDNGIAALTKAEARELAAALYEWAGPELPAATEPAVTLVLVGYQDLTGSYWVANGHGRYRLGNTLREAHERAEGTEHAFEGVPLSQLEREFGPLTPVQEVL